MCMAIWSKWPGQQRKFILLLRDSARAHSTTKMQNLMWQFDWTVFEHPTYSKDLTPSNYHLFLELKNCLSWQQFVDDTELITFVNSLLWKVMLDFYNRGICKLISRYKKCLEHRGNYVKKYVISNILQNTSSRLMEEMRKTEKGWLWNHEWVGNVG